jgi:hypothetical protein
MKHNMKMEGLTFFILTSAFPQEIQNGERDITLGKNWCQVMSQQDK